MPDEDVARKRQAEFAATLMMAQMNGSMLHNIEALLTIIHIAEKHEAPFNPAHLRAAGLHLVDAIEQVVKAVEDGDDEFREHLKAHPEGRVALAQHTATLAEYRKMIETDTIDCGGVHDEPS